MKLICQRGSGNKLYTEEVVDSLLGESRTAGRELGRQILNKGEGLQEERMNLLAPEKVIMNGDLVRVIDAVENKIFPAVVKGSVSYTLGEDRVVTCSITVLRKDK